MPRKPPREQRLAEVALVDFALHQMHVGDRPVVAEHLPVIAEHLHGHLPHEFLVRTIVLQELELERNLELVHSITPTLAVSLMGAWQNALPGCSKLSVRANSIASASLVVQATVRPHPQTPPMAIIARLSI
jgi:hypothetical protein